MSSQDNNEIDTFCRCWVSFEGLLLACVVSFYLSKISIEDKTGHLVEKSKKKILGTKGREYLAQRCICHLLTVRFSKSVFQC